MRALFHLKVFKFVALAFFTLSIFSCKEGIPSPQEQKQTIQLNKTTGTLTIGEELVLTPTFVPVVPNRETYKWKVDNSQVVDIRINSDHSATVVAKSKGKTEVSISSPNGEILARCQITVVEDDTPDDRIIKILAIGNSFSEDAVEYYLHGLATAAGKNVVIGNLYIGGAQLTQHVQNANNDAAAYAYRKIDQNGDKTNTSNTSIATALADEEWDYISFQQASSYSGQYNTFTTSLPTLYNYVKERATNPVVKYVLHQTWAYAQNSTHAGFANYGRDQETMYLAIVDTYKKAKDLIDADLVVPAGTAIQNGRTSVIGDNFCKDGYHLDVNIGRYTASCSWFETIFGESVIGNTYRPAALTDYETEIAQHAAHRAVETPHAVTPMSDYQGGSSGITDNPVLISFGINTTSPNWNGFTKYTKDAAIANLRDDKRNYTGVSLVIVEPFNGKNANGPQETTTVFDIPGDVSSDSYFGNPKKDFGGIVSQSVLKFENLDKTKEYNFCFFGSRMDASDNRETKYLVKGRNEGTALLNASNNISNIACVNNIQPNVDGEISITITAGEQNTNEHGFYYINALRLTLAD